jgi:hypothetical protein
VALSTWNFKHRLGVATIYLEKKAIALEIILYIFYFA